MAVGLVTSVQRIANFIKKCSFNPLKTPKPVYWPDLVELSSIIDSMYADIKNINNNLPSFWSASYTGVPYNWFTEVYESENVTGLLTTLYQDVINANSISSSGTSIDYHYRVDVAVGDGATVYVKMQQDPALNVGIVGMQVGDLITGSSSGATGSVISVSGTYVMIKITSGTFTTSDTITGSISGIVASVLNVYPLINWDLGVINPANNKSHYISGKIFFTNVMSKQAVSEINVIYNGLSAAIQSAVNISGFNNFLPIKLMLQGIGGVSGNIKAIYGRGLIYQLAPQIP